MRIPQSAGGRVALLETELALADCNRLSDPQGASDRTACRTGQRKRQHLKLIRTVGRHEQMLKEKGRQGSIGINYGPIGRI
jgi:hypothetical protein